MKEKIYDARTGMEYVLVGDYYLPALKLPRTRPIGRWGMLHKAYLKLRKPAYYQSLLLSGKLDTVLANVEEQAAERYKVLIEQMSQREETSEKLKEENQMEWIRRMNNLENRAAEIVKAELIYGKHQAGNYTKHQYPLKGKVYCGYCQKLMKYRVLKKLGPSFNCRFSATAADSPCKRIPISEKVLEEIIRNALTAQIKQAEYVLEILHERERKALICFSALERQEEKLSAEKTEIVKQRVALYEQYADGNMSKEEFIRQRDAYRVQEDEKMEQIQRLRTEKNQAFQPVKRDTDHLQTVMSTVEEAGDVMYLSQNVVETFIDRIEVFNDEHVKIHFTFENVLADYAE